MFKSSFVTASTLVMVAVVLVSGQSGAQYGSCLNDLTPCLNYLNDQNGNRNPPESCCDPLKDVIKDKEECLCMMISSEGSARAEQAGINVTQAQQLPGLCGQHVNPLSCLDLRPTADSSSTTTIYSASSSRMIAATNSLAPLAFFFYLVV